MAELNQTLQHLVAKACQYPIGSWQRQQLYGQIYFRVMRSRKLWREYSSYYEDALQEMWEYCFRHLEEYDPQISGVITWMDNRLKKRLRYHRDVSQRNCKRQQMALAIQDGAIDPLEVLAAPPDIQPSLVMWQQVLEWLHADPDAVLKRICFRQRAEINAQAIILKRLPPDIAWKDIAAEFRLSAMEAKDLPKWYHRHCLSQLKSFGRLHGYLS